MLVVAATLSAIVGASSAHQEAVNLAFSGRPMPASRPRVLDSVLSPAQLPAGWYRLGKVHVTHLPIRGTELTCRRSWPGATLLTRISSAPPNSPSSFWVSGRGPMAHSRNRSAEPPFLRSRWPRGRMPTSAPSNSRASRISPPRNGGVCGRTNRSRPILGPILEHFRCRECFSVNFPRRDGHVARRDPEWLLRPLHRDHASGITAYGPAVEGAIANM